jgi:hypothetical protein
MIRRGEPLSPHKIFSERFLTVAARLSEEQKKAQLSNENWAFHEYMHSDKSECDIFTA